MEKRLSVFKEFTKNLADLSKCQEGHVAAIITDAGLSQVHSIGINGGPKKLFDCLCVVEGKYGCIHAEINAITKCKVMEADKIMFITLAPCKQCATAIINEPGGFSKVYYFKDWKEEAGIQLLRAAGIQVLQL